MSQVSVDNCGTVLVVDDDSDILDSARLLLSRHGWKVQTAPTLADAWTILIAERIDLVLLDLNFSRGATTGEEGLAWLERLRAHDPTVTVIVVTAHSGISVAIQAMKAGASDFVMKPWSNARLLETLRDGLAHARERQEPSNGDAAPRQDVMLGDSPALRQVRERLERAALVDAPVLLHGPAGAGKSLAARVLHARSRRANGPFVSLDLRGADFTCFAVTLNEALAKSAGGTLLLDDISLLPPNAQSELARRLDLAPDVRVLSTTQSKEVLTEVREDLLMRLATIDCLIPSLSARADDAILLMEHFVRLFSRQAGRAPKPLDGSAIDLLRSGAFPGEVRGLRQAAERAVALSDSNVLTPLDLTPATTTAQTPGGGGDLNLTRSEKMVIEAALKRHAHNVSHAAKALGLTRATLYRRMIKHGL